MKITTILAILLVSSAAFAGEPKTIRELFSKPEVSLSPKAKKPKAPVSKGASYLLTYQDEDDQWHETEVIATGRFTSHCDGVRYEVDAGDFSYFALPKSLRLIHGSHY